MIRVLSYSVYKDGDNERLAYRSYKDGFYQLANNYRVNEWRESLEEEYAKIFRTPVRVYVARRAKPEKEIDLLIVFFNVAKVMNLDYDKVMTVHNKREYVDARKIATKILFDLDYNPMDIERRTPLKNRAVYDYRAKIEDRLSVDIKFREQFEKIKVDVLDMTFKNRTNDSESGESTQR